MSKAPSPAMRRSAAPLARYLRPALLVLAALLGLPAARAQQGALLPASPAAPADERLRDFAYLDSLVMALAAQYRWAALDSVGRRALALGTDYPGLRRRLGQAALAREQPAQALRHYGRALRENPVDTTARYGLALAYLALNQPGPAALVARYLPDSLRGPLHLRGFQALTRVELEGSAQWPGSIHRGPAGFGRLGLGTRLSPRLSLTQNLSYFGQTIELPAPFRRRMGEQYPIRQTQYHVLLEGQLAPRWRALAGLHLLRSDFGGLSSRGGLLGYAALAYARPYWQAQVGVFAGTLTDTARLQADLRLTVYPLGSLRFYAYGRASVVRSGGRNFPTGVLGAGGRLHRALWLDGYGSLGLAPVLAELDGTYVYNLFDPIRARAGANLLILLSRPLSLRLSYGAEQRRDAINGRPYPLHSLSTTLAWTW